MKELENQLPVFEIIPEVALYMPSKNHWETRRHLRIFRI